MSNLAVPATASQQQQPGFVKGPKCYDQGINTTTTDQFQSQKSGVFVVGCVGARLVTFLVDTGSSITLLHQGVWSKTPSLQQIPLQQPELSAVSANGATTHLMYQWKLGNLNSCIQFMLQTTSIVTASLVLMC